MHGVVGVSCVHDSTILYENLMRLCRIWIGIENFVHTRQSIYKRPRNTDIFPVLWKIQQQTFCMFIAHIIRQQYVSHVTCVSYREYIYI